MTCPACKTVLNRVARFCSVCGHQLPISAEVAILDAEPHDLAVGCVVDGKYRIGRRLVSGSFATTYRAQHVALAGGASGHFVVLTVLHSAAAMDPGVREHVYQSWSDVRIDHPSAARIYDAGISREGLVYFASEVLKGASLRSAVGERGPVPPAVAVEIVERICAVLDAAHRRGFVHGNLSPDSVVVDAADGVVRVKVAEIETAGVRSALYDAGMFGKAEGTAEASIYRSPEQRRGERPDARSDVYSVGALLYEMLIGVAPSESTADVRHTAPVRSWNPALGSEVEQVIRCAMSPRREDRQKSVVDLALQFRCAVGAPAPVTVSRGRTTPVGNPPTSAFHKTPTAVAPSAAAPVAVAPGAAPVVVASSRALLARAATAFALLVALVFVVSVAFAGLRSWNGDRTVENGVVEAAPEEAIDPAITDPTPAEATDAPPAPAEPPPAPRRTPRTATESVSIDDTTGVTDSGLATGVADGLVARVQPGGSLVLSFPVGAEVTDDGTATPDIRVVGVAGEPVSYRLDVRQPDGTFVRIDRRTKFGGSDMRHHGVAATDMVKITNTGTTDLLIDAVESCM